MVTFRHVVAAALVIAVATPSAYAQGRHVVDAASVARLAREHAAAQQQDRAAVRDALARPEVQRVAAAAGINLDQVTAAVDTLAASDLARAASAAHEVNQSLDQSPHVGGASSVTLSTTTIIIGLLVLILLIVALK